MDLRKLKENLEKRGFKVSLFATAKEGAAYLNGQIDSTSVGIGGSVTVKEMGLFPLLSAHNEVWWHNDPEQVAIYGDGFIRQKAERTAVYISSVNGISESGQIVNIDGRGNRLAATLNGHDKVYLLIGKNKIAPDLEGAIWRARNIAAPKNAQRLGIKTPCAIKGDKCYDCNSPQRICRGILIFERGMLGKETEILLFDEEIGY